VIVVAAVPDGKPPSFPMIILFIFGFFYDTPHRCDIISP
jgi:hypothetical protein